MATYVDLTEFLSSPHRTGIQRVGGELCRHWDSAGDLVPVKLTSEGTLVALSEGARSVIASYFDAPPEQAAEIGARIVAIRDQADRAGRVVNFEKSKVIVPEVFYDPKRLAFFRALTPARRKNFFFIVFDSLPLTHPQYFAPDMPHQLIGGYFQVIRKAVHAGFISAATRDVYYQRLVRRCGSGPVLRLGSNSLGEPFDPQSRETVGRHFTVFGTIEPRKQHDMVLRAFESLFDDGYDDVTLTFIGKMGWIEAAASKRLREALLRYPANFRWIEHAGDRCMYEEIRASRATLFLSAVEGYGLPPVESLYLGVPVIASPNIPSLEQVRKGIRICGCSENEIKQAVLDLCDDKTFEELSAEVRQLSLPTWKSFVEDVESWLTKP